MSNGKPNSCHAELPELPVPMILKNLPVAVYTKPDDAPVFSVNCSCVTKVATVYILCGNCNFRSRIVDGAPTTNSYT